MKFFNIDLHISVIADISHIFSELGHTVDINYLSNHSWVFDKSPNNSFCINQGNWMSINQKMCDDFYDENKNKLDKYDGFIVTHIPALSLLYQKFNKPIIFVSSTRYEFPFTNDPFRWTWFNNYIRGNNNLIFVANNLYDKWYSESFLGKEFIHIPSICEYTNTKYTGLYKKSLLSSKIISVNSDKIINKNSLGKYKWSQISDFESIIHIPYNVSTMSIFENYTSNIPMFFPDKDFNLSLAKSGHSMTELTYNQVIGMSPGSRISINGIDPNNYKSEDLLKKSIELSDFYNYDMKEVVLFKDIDDLNYKIHHSNFSDISNKMSQHNKERKDTVYNNWKKILEKI